MKESTLCYFIDNSHHTFKVLLGKKLRGRDVGKFNGYGGKRETSDDTVISCLLRECKEEAGITPINPFERGEIKYEFFIPNVKDKQVLRVYLYTADDWTGKPTTFDEMEPYWFKFEDIPWEQMQTNDKLWLETLLTTNMKINAFLSFDREDNQLSESYIRWT